MLSNFAMYDQIESLKWVRDHIRYFGGNPNSVSRILAIIIQLEKHLSRYIIAENHYCFDRRQGQNAPNASLLIYCPGPSCCICGKTTLLLMKGIDGI